MLDRWFRGGLTAGAMLTALGAVLRLAGDDFGWVLAGQALVAVARSILVIVWHLLADPAARYQDLGADFYTNRVNKNRKTRQLVHQLQALGHHVTLQPIAMAA